MGRLEYLTKWIPLTFSNCDNTFISKELAFGIKAVILQLIV